MTRQVVLVGAGHAHMEALKKARRFANAGLSLTLIDPGAFWYSGAATGMLSGALDPDAARLNPSDLEGPFDHVRQRVVSVDPQARTVTLQDGERRAYDVLSLNTGSRIAETPLLAAGAIPVKPVSALAGLRATLEANLGQLRLAVAGAGATGVEIALSMASLQRRLGARPQTLLAGPDLMPGWPDRARRLALEAMARCGVEYVPHRVEDLSMGLVHFGQRKVAPVDILVAATGLSANVPDGLQAPEEGLPVNADLSWTGDPVVFAAGDCARMVDHPRPKLGVFGVRAAPILVQNLINAATGRQARRHYTPQSRWLSILDVGDGTGLARYGDLAFSGKPVLHLKRWLDSRFLQRYRVEH